MHTEYFDYVENVVYTTPLLYRKIDTVSISYRIPKNDNIDSSQERITLSHKRTTPST